MLSLRCVTLKCPVARNVRSKQNLSAYPADVVTNVRIRIANITAGTVFESTRTPLVDWFFVIYLMTSTRNGVAAKEIQRQLGVTYKTAWRMGHHVRMLMEHGSDLLTGVIEADECYIGNNPKNVHRKKYIEQYGRGRDMAPVIAMVERNTGEVRCVAPEKVDGRSIYDAVTGNVQRGERLITDAHSGYKWVGRQYKHTSIKHVAGYITEGEKHTNTVEGFFSHLKRTIKGTHIHVSRKHLQKYANECSFRYTHRNEGQLMFHTILERVVA
jgi:transposase